MVLRARAIEAFVATAIVLLGVFLVSPPKALIVVLSQNTLKAPMKRQGLSLLKSATVDLSEIVVSRYLVDRIFGTQLATNDEEIIQVNSVLYSAHAVRKLLDEIEFRQELLKNTNQGE